MRKIKKIVIHHTASPSKTTTLPMIEKWHEERGLGKGCQYHYVVFPNGTSKHPKDDSVITAHCKGQNPNSIGICLTGNFDLEEPTNEALEKLKNILFLLCDRYSLTSKDIYAHGELKETACPGKHLYSQLPNIKFKVMRRNDPVIPEGTIWDLKGLYEACIKWLSTLLSKK